jgi:hypothetical protein
MPRTAKPGSERYRDERRKGGGPRMHARGWHDHDEPHELERVADNEGTDAVIEAESSGDRFGFGMGRMHRASGTSQGGERRKRSVPPGKGKSKRAAGAKSKASNLSGTVKKAGPRGPRRI